MRTSLSGSIACLVAMVVVVPAAIAQPAPAVIRGRIVADGNERPLRRALVAVTGSKVSARPVLTDDEGRFEIQAPDPQAAFTVTKAGYAATKVTVPRATRDRRELVVRMPRGGVISGRVLDSKGETAIGARVTARLDGAAADGTVFEAEADDLGEYRISGLPPGRYVVSPGIAGTRVLTEADYARVVDQMKQGRRMQDILLDPTGPERVADVRSGEETGSVDFEVKPSATIRALRQTPVTPPETLSTTTAPQPEVTSIAVGPPQTALGGGRVVTVMFSNGARSLNLALTGGGAVSGTVVDSAGEPFQGISVSALQVRYESGRAVARAVGWTRVTDDRGRYRLFGLVPGSYLIVASLDAEESSPKDEATGFAPLYYPGTANIEAAQLLRLTAGSDLSGTDLTFAATSVVRVTGKALDFVGQPLVGRVLLGVSQRSASITSDRRVVKTGKEGSFEFTDVPPGDYVVQAMADAGFGGPAEFGSEYVTVGDRNPPPVTVPTSRGATLAGRFVVEGAIDPPMRAYSLLATPLDLDRSPAGGRGPSGLAIHDDGQFYLSGLHGVMRLSAPNALPGWYLKSITIGGVDVTDRSYDFGFADVTLSDAEVVLSNNAAGVAGSIERQSEREAVAATVIAFSTNRDVWFAGSRHVKWQSSTARGSFAFEGLPPGEYFIAAVDASIPVDLQAPDTLDTFVSRAARVTAREGTVSEVTLSLIRR